jgi:hypothetical protein
MVLVTILTGAVSRPAAAIPAFELRDQNERQHSSRTLLRHRKPVLVISGDQRKSDRDIATWHEALRKAGVKGVVIRGLVDLEGVPFFIPNALVRRALRKSNPRLPVLCDYEGKVFKRLELPPGGVAVTVLDPRGKKVGRVRGKASKDGLARIKHLLERSTEKR